jgi:DNA-binding IclR family transcriptional regulator
VTTAEKSLIRSLQRGLQIINIVALQSPIHAKLVARSAGLSLPTAYHLLRTLVHDGYLSRLPDGTYVLGERLRQDGFVGPPSLDPPPIGPGETISAIQVLR